MAKDTTPKGIGSRIRSQREKLGFNQARLATEANITPAAISQIEAGDRTPSTPILRKIASVLKVSSDFLLGTTDKSEIEDLLQDSSIQKFFRGFQDLSASDKQHIMKQIEMLKNFNKK